MVVGLPVEEKVEGQVPALGLHQGIKERGEIDRKNGHRSSKRRKGGGS